MNKDLIINSFSKFKKITITSVEKFGKNHPNEIDELKQILENEPAWINLQNVIIGIIENKELKKCKTCGTTLPFNKWLQNYCSKKCLNNDADIRNKIKQTCFEKYGVDNPAKANESKEKTKRTSLEKYGVDNPAKAEINKEKSKKTCLERYGVEYTTQSEQMKNAAKKTCLEKYGVEHYVNAEKQRRTVLNNAYEKILKFENVYPEFSDSEYIGVVNQDNLYKWKCKKCGNIFEDHLYFNKPRCLKCYPKHQPFSKLEKELLDFIKEIHSGKILENDRSIIKPYELDIVLPEKKIAFEFNGTFWHSELSPGFDKNKNKCLMKTNLCNEAGYKLIHIWEHDWIYEKEYLKQIIKSFILPKYDVSNFLIKEINNIELNLFLSDLKFYKSDYKIYKKLGLFENNKLKEVMLFKRYGNEYIINDYISKNNNSNGFELILNKFIEIEKPPVIKGYVKIENFNNFENLILNGFNIIKQTKYDYCYISKDYKIKYSSSQCKRKFLKKLLGDNFHDELSEFENMTLNGFYRVYDCGNYVFEKQL